MGFRFSKRITIIPGVRINISRSGLSTSVGPRGLSMAMGKNGTYLNAGLPGTGLAYRERIDRPRRAGSLQPAPEQGGHAGPIKVAVNDDGTVLLTDLDDNALPPAVVKRAKAEKAESIQELLEKAAEKINIELNECLGVHLPTPNPNARPEIPKPFSIDEPRRPSVQAPSLVDRLLLRSDRMDNAAQEAETQYQRDLLDWNAAREAHEKERAKIEKVFRLAAKGFSAQMEAALDYVLSGIAWPKATQVDYEFTQDVTGIALDVDLPDEDEVPRRAAEACGNGKLSFKNHTAARVRRNFVALCYGSLFRVVGEVFALLPDIQKCLVSGYIQRTNPANGVVENQYVISAMITREQWDSLNFARLDVIDPAATLNAAGARVGLDRSARFKAITPFDMSVLD